MYYGSLRNCFGFFIFLTDNIISPHDDLRGVSYISKKNHGIVFFMELLCYYPSIVFISKEYYSTTVPYPS